MNHRTAQGFLGNTDHRSVATSRFWLRQSTRPWARTTQPPVTTRGRRAEGLDIGQVPAVQAGQVRAAVVAAMVSSRKASSHTPRISLLIKGHSTGHWPISRSPLRKVSRSWRCQKSLVYGLERPR
ncbi:hypothetical protein G3H79_40520 [Streptomyces aureoverticillatus]|nr:hypothetical protein [Streptomyces aureoverticillatus]QIB41699.1 hypothetical protein G3H79_00015 [Streptomyces aureoverticillatus]QIB48439.1 hypothetical protein G3H79_40520 [Streptomyces aureoverticillatus]